MRPSSRSSRKLIRLLGLAALLPIPTLDAAEKGKVIMDRVEHRGWKDNVRISNGDAELIVTLDVGPRIISYRLADGKNVFKEYTEQLGKSGEDEWMIRGGHRLWAGPEDTTRTYALDNGPVEVQMEAESGLIRFTPAPDTAYGLQKEIDVKLEPTGSRVTVIHRIRNVGSRPTELAPWALTVMAPGGVEVIPLPPKRPHPGPPKNAKSPADFAAELTMTLWPYFDFKDPRWSFGTSFITLRQDASRGPTKIGLSNRLGWVGHLNGGTLFVKRFEYRGGQPYPDNGCNFETFTNQDMTEIESLGPLVTLPPGHTVEHTEHWELIPNVKDFRDEAEIRANVLAKVKPE